jgi:hypothetical protein
VLTAAHVVFDDRALAFVPNNSVKWFFQRHAGTYEPAPLTPRGWIKLDGYAAARSTNAIPGSESTAAQELDVAALYFNESAGRGGYSGYLVSTNDELINAASLATIIGYPVENLAPPAGQPGQMHATRLQHIYWNSALAPHVFPTTTVKTYPGNSGGPLCFQYTNGSWYPAAVFLGGSGNTVVRVIDSAAAGAIIAAEQASNDGRNSSGGEPPIQPCLTCPPTGIYAYLDVYLAPTNIGTLGGGYRFDLTNVVHRDAYTRFQVFGNVPYTINFLPPTDPHIFAPNPRSITNNVPTGRTNSIYITYKPWGQLQSASGNTFRLLGASGVVYRIDFKSNLNQSAWIPVRTQTLNSSSMTLTLTNLVPGASNGFIRSVLLP